MKTKTENNYNMREEIITNLDNPRQLEKLYRDNQTAFKKAFSILFPEIQEKTTAQIWNERLSFEQQDISWGTRKELILVITVSFIAGLMAKIPDFFSIDPEYYYPRNLGFIVFPMLAIYFAWKHQIQRKTIITAAVAFGLSALYINFLPNDAESDTLILACIHLPLFLWAVLGYTFVGDQFRNYARRLDFLKYNGDVVVMTTLIVIAGGLFSGVTMGLFELIDIKIEDFYFKKIAIWGLAAAPILGTFLVQTNPQLVGKVSPVIARVFTPIVLVTLVIYLIAVIYTGKDPYNDREFLLVFNALLIGVMAIIFFSIAEAAKNTNNKIGILLLFSLSLVTVILNGIALSAILFRISEWGITPNRLAVLGGNILMLINLLLVTNNLFKTLKYKNDIEKVEESIASFLTVYTLWTIVVAFLFPVFFGFK